MNLFLVNLLITVVVELLLNRYVVQKFWQEGPSSQRVFLANAISNPLAQVIYRSILSRMWLIEAMVVGFEALFYARTRKNIWPALAASLFLNASSLLAGFAMQSVMTAMLLR